LARSLIIDKLECMTMFITSAMPLRIVAELEGGSIV